MTIGPLEITAAALFALAVVHTFSTRYFEHLAHTRTAHAGIWQAAFCDGSVTQISYSMDIQVGKKLANRRDGQYVDRP